MGVHARRPGEQQRGTRLAGRIAAGDHPAGRIDERGDRLARADHLAQHRRQLGNGVEDDCHAAGQGAGLRRPYRRQVDIGRLSGGQRVDRERRHRVALRVAQALHRRQDLRRHAGTDERAGAVLARSGPHRALRVEGHQARVHRVKAVDVLQHGRQARIGGRIGCARQGRLQRRGQGPPAAVVGPLVQIAVHDVGRQSRQIAGLVGDAGKRCPVQLAHGLIDPRPGACAGQADLREHRLQARPVVALGARHQPSVPDHAPQVAIDHRGLVLNGDQVGVVEGDGVVVCTGVAAAERRQQGDHCEAAPTWPHVALVAVRRAGDGQILATAEDHAIDCAFRSRRQPHAQRHMALVVARHHALLAVQEHDGKLVAAVGHAGKDARHLVGKAEAQNQDAEPAAAVLDAMRVQQRGRAPGQIGRSVALHVAGRRQGLAHDRVGTARRHRRVIEPDQYLALGVEQDDVVVDGVLGPVLGQAAAHVVAGLTTGCGIARAKPAQDLVGGQETDVGGAFEQVAHQDVDHALRLGRQLVLQFSQALRSQAFHQAPLQAVEALTGLGQRRQDRLHVLWTADRCAGLDHLPGQAEVAHIALGGLHPTHVRNQILDLDHRGSPFLRETKPSG